MNAFAHPSSKEKKLYTIMLLLGLTAVVVTLNLIYVHLLPSEGGSFCNISDYWNCDRVNKSTFAEILGIPVSFYGFFYYSFISLIYFGLLKGHDFNKRFATFHVKILLKAALLGASLGSVFLLTQEFTLLGNLGPLAVIKSILFVIAYIFVYKYAKKHENPRVDLLAILNILTLFGVSFSLYLTDIELFVLEAICIFCLTQQILIVIISAFNLKALKQSTKTNVQPNPANQQPV